MSSSTKVVIIAGVAVGAGVLLYFALKDDGQLQANVQPVLTSAQAMQIALDTTAQEQKEIVSQLNVKLPTIQPGANGAIPFLPIAAHVQSSDQSAEVMNAIAQGKTPKPSYWDSYKDQGWWNALGPLTFASAGVSYGAKKDEWEQQQEEAQRLKQQVKLDEKNRLTNEGMVNWDMYYDYEKETQKESGNIFNMSAAQDYAAYLATTSPNQFKSFMGAWQNLGQENSLGKPEVPKPKAPKMADFKDMPKEEATAAYNAAMNQWRQTANQYDIDASLAVGTLLTRQTSNAVLDEAFTYKGGALSAGGKGAYTQASIASTIPGYFGNIIKKAWGLEAKQISEPTSTLSDGAIVGNYSGLVYTAGANHPEGSYAFIIPAPT